MHVDDPDRTDRRYVYAALVSRTSPRFVSAAFGRDAHNRATQNKNGCPQSKMPIYRQSKSDVLCMTTNAATAVPGRYVRAVGLGQCKAVALVLVVNFVFV